MANWKKVLVSGSAADVTNLTATGTVTFEGISAQNGYLLQTDGDGNISVVDPTSVGGGGNLYITASGTNFIDLSLADDRLALTSDYGVDFTLSETENTASIKINTPQDLRITATPTFDGLKVSGSSTDNAIIFNNPTTGDTVKITHDLDNNLLNITSNKTIISLNSSNDANDREIVLNATTTEADRDVNVTIKGKTDNHLLFTDAAASASGQAERGVVGIGFRDGGRARLNERDVLQVSGSANFSEAVTASAFSGDGSGLTNVTATEATTLTGFSVTEYGSFTSSIYTFTSSIQDEVDTLYSQTSSYATVEGDTSVTNTVPFYNNTDRELNGGSETFKVTYNSEHFPEGGGPDADLNDGSGSYYLFVESASIGSDLYVGGDIDLIGTINNIVGFNFYEGNITTVSGAVQFGSGSTPAAIDLSGGHQFTGSLRISGGLFVDSLSVSEQDNIVVYNAATGQFFYTSSISGDSIQGGTIGNAGDGTYTDGFFNYFTPSTTIGTAIDDISEAFSLLAPGKTDYIETTNLDDDIANEVTAKLSANLNSLSSNWYVFGKTAGDTVNYSDDSAFSISLANDIHIGKGSDFLAGSLVGGITASIASGSSTVSTLNRRNFIDGDGNSATIKGKTLSFSNSGTYGGDGGNFWAKTKASLAIANDSNLIEGGYHVSFTGSGDSVSSDGYSNQSKTIWRSSVTSISSTGTTSTLIGSANTNQVSGQTFIDAGTVYEIDVSATNLYNPVYQDQNIDISSTYFTNVATSSFDTSTTPNYDDVVTNQNVCRVTILDNVSSGISAGTYSVDFNKPRNSVSIASTNISSTPINSKYGSDTNNQTSKTNDFRFYDEVFRYEGLDAANRSWDNTSATLISSNANLAVANGRLILPEHYSTVASYVSNNGFNEYNYIRKIHPGNSPVKQSGTLTITKTNGSFDNTIQQFDNTSIRGLRVAIVKASEATGELTATIIHDLGRGVGNNSGIYKGASVTTVATNPTSITVNFNLAYTPGIFTDTTDTMLWVKYRKNGSSGSTINSGDYITAMDLDWN